MQIVMTEGRFTLLPIDGEEPGTRAGYYFQFSDPASAIEMVAPLPYEQAEKLAQSILADVEAHRPGKSKVEVASVAALHNLQKPKG